jgi:hypothetical protein
VYGTKCGYFSNVENCRPATACVVDMYIDDNAVGPPNTNPYDEQEASIHFSEESDKQNDICSPDMNIKAALQARNNLLDHRTNGFESLSKPTQSPIWDKRKNGV